MIKIFSPIFNWWQNWKLKILKTVKIKKYNFSHLSLNSQSLYVCLFAQIFKAKNMKNFLPNFPPPRKNQPPRKIFIKLIPFPSNRLVNRFASLTQGSRCEIHMFRCVLKRLWQLPPSDAKFNQMHAEVMISKKFRPHPSLPIDLCLENLFQLYTRPEIFLSVAIAPEHHITPKCDVIKKFHNSFFLLIHICFSFFAQ